MRLATNKSTLKNKLKVEITGLSVPKANIVIIDGSAVLWAIHWPTQGTVKDFIENFVSYIIPKMKEADVYLIFDRYETYSTKGATRTARGKEASRHHQLSLSTQLPSQKVVLTVSYNKVQLIALIVDALQTQKDRIGLTNHKLVVTGPDPVPVEISLGMTIHRADLCNTQEEADVIIINQLLCIFDSTREGKTVSASF